MTEKTKKIKQIKHIIFIISFIIFMASILSIVTWATVRIYKYIVFNKNCTEYINNSASVDSIKIAKKELDHAISYLEEKNLTEGRVSIVTSQMKNDIGYFYENLKEQQEFLNIESQKELSAEEEKVILEEYRNNIDKHPEPEYFYLKIPDGMSIYPYNVAYFWWIILSILALIISLCTSIKMSYDLDY